MRILTALLAGAMVMSGGVAQAATDHGPQAKLAKALEGRVAGKPVTCLNLRDIRSTRIVDNTAILYETGGGKIYVNTPRSGASSLRDGRVMVTDTRSSQLCSIDTVRLYDNGSRMEMGWVGLGDFVPYAKPAKPRAI